jgi:hypothetical protein
LRQRLADGCWIADPKDADIHDNVRDFRGAEMSGIGVLEPAAFLKRIGVLK